MSAELFDHAFDDPEALTRLPSQAAHISNNNTLALVLDEAGVAQRRSRMGHCGSRTTYHFCDPHRA